MKDVEKSEISPHVEWFQISSHDTCGEIWNLLQHMYKLWYFVAFYTVLFLRFTQFCRKIDLLRFTRYCVEKIWAKNSACGEKLQVSGMLRRSAQAIALLLNRQQAQVPFICAILRIILSLGRFWYLGQVLKLGTFFKFETHDIRDIFFKFWIFFILGTFLNLGNF